MPNGGQPTGIAGWLWDNVSGFFTSMFENVWYGFTNIFPSAIEATWDTIKARVVKKDMSTMVSIMDNFVQIGIITKEQGGYFKEFCRSVYPFDFWAASFIATILLSNYLKNVVQIVGGKSAQDLNRMFSPNPPGAGEVIQAAFVAPEKTGEVRDAMKRSGLSDEDIDLLFLSRYALYDVNQIKELYLRKVLSEDEMYVRMRELGFTDTRIKEITQSWQIIPGPQDLLMMVAKEAFEPDEIERYNLAEEFPEEQSDWLTKQGLTRYWQEKYWAAHWDYPSYGQVIEMLHRGLLTEADVYEYYRIIEIPRYWRDLLTKINYTPYSRVDVRRMHKMGVLTDEELLQSYRDIGYDEAHAQKMSEFTVKYNQQDEKALTQSQIIKGYNSKLISREDTKSLLGQLGWTDDGAEYLLTMEDFKETMDIQDDIIATIKDRYTGNLIDKNEALDRLNKLNLPAVKINALLERWDVKRFMDVKLPSKTDLDKMLKNKIINEDKYRFQMEKLGYGYEYTDWYLSLIKMGKAG
jgi:hypothetical protein